MKYFAFDLSLLSAMYVIITPIVYQHNCGKIGAMVVLVGTMWGKWWIGGSMRAALALLLVVLGCSTCNHLFSNQCTSWGGCTLTFLHLSSTGNCRLHSRQQCKLSHTLLQRIVQNLMFRTNIWQCFESHHPPSPAPDPEGERNFIKILCLLYVDLKDSRKFNALCIM